MKNKDIKWFWAMNKPQRPLIWDSFKITNANSHKYFEIPYSMAYSKIIDGDIYFGKELANKIQDSIKTNIENDIDYPTKIAKKLYEVKKKVHETTGKVHDFDLKKLTNTELKKLFNEFYRQIGLMECFMSYRGSVQMVDVLSEKVKTLLASRLNNIGRLEQLDEYFLLLSIPRKESIITDIQSEVLKSCLRINQENKEQIINELHKRFSWIGCIMFNGRHLNKEHFEEEIKSKLNLDCREKLKKRKQQKQEREEKIKNLIEELEFSETEKKHLENLREWCFLRTYAKDAVSKAVGDTMYVLFEIASRAGIDEENIVYLSKDELNEIFETKKSTLTKKISKRKTSWGAYAIHDEVRIFDYKNIHKIKEREEEKCDVNEVNGMVANRGYVKGIVINIKDASEIDKIKEGNILITSMTTTDFTPILDKISGLVTDEGGISCHAAIISREMNIPCIIGTKIATKAFRSGDIIEVDANNGIVKKIK